MGNYGAVNYNGAQTISLSEGYTANSMVGGKAGNPNAYQLVLRINQTGSQTGEIGTVTIPVTTTNYTGLTLTVKVKAVNQIIPEKVGTVSADAITYGQTLNDSTITFTGKMPDIAAMRKSTARLHGKMALSSLMRAAMKPGGYSPRTSPTAENTQRTPAM